MKDDVKNPAEDPTLIRKMRALKWLFAAGYIVVSVAAWVSGMKYMERLVYNIPINYWVLGCMVLAFLLFIYYLVQGYEIAIDTANFYRESCVKYSILASDVIKELEKEVGYSTYLKERLIKGEKGEKEDESREA